MAETMTGDALITAPSSPGDPVFARTRADGARLGMDYTPPERTRAIRAADRHTARVKFLKRSFAIASLLGTTTILIVVLFNPFRHLPGAISLASVGVSGTKITLDLPKLSGVQQGGGPYEVKAKTGIQDITTPSLMEMLGVDARVAMADLTTTHVTSDHGLYDSRADSMTLAGAVKIVNTGGYTLNLRTAQFDFRAGTLTSHERLRVEIKGGEVSSDDMVISNSGQVIYFTGHVASRFDTDSSEDGAAVQQATAEAR